MKNKKRSKVITLILVLVVSLNIGLIINTSLNDGGLPKRKHKITENIKSPKSSSISTPQETLVYGIGKGPSSIDPQHTYDVNSFTVIDNVCERLFAYNLSDPNLGLIPQLASDFGTWNGANYTVDLRHNITFHDGTVFNADDVIWTFDRLENLMSLNKVDLSNTYIYYDPDFGAYRNIINDTVKIDNYTVRFVLNSEYGPFEDILAFQGSSIISEESAPFDDIINITTDDLIGTGPFNYISYNANHEVKFESFNDYWQGTPYFDKLIFSIIPDPAERHNAFISGEVDILTDPYHNWFDTITYTNGVELHSDGPDFTEKFVGINNKKINVSIREAISYGLNYSRILEDIYHGYGYRAKSPIPQGVKFSNYSYDVAIHNITRSRQIMQQIFPSEAPNDLYNDSAWQETTLKTYNYSYAEGGADQENMLPILEDSLKQIGIEVIGAGMTWNELLSNLFDHPNNLRLYWVGWRADYNDGSNFLKPYSNRSKGLLGVNDPQAQLWMEEALLETNETIRQDLYNKIQKRYVEEVYPVAFGFSDENSYAWRTDIEGFQPNALEINYFYPCYKNYKNGVSIDGDATGINAHNWTWAEDQAWCKGLGTLDDPYIISGINIESKEAEIGIEIKNSDVYFKIQDCYITNTIDAGIKLEGVSNGEIKDSIIANTNNGIYLNLSNSNHFEMNMIFNNSNDGISLVDSSENLVYENWIWNCNNSISGDTYNNFIGGNYYYSVYEPDTDGDGLLDQIELSLGTNPSYSDTDGDHFSDGYEYDYGTDPLNQSDYPVLWEEHFNQLMIYLNGNWSLLQNVIDWSEGNSTLIDNLIIQLEENSTLLQKVIGWLDGNSTEIEDLFTYLEANATLLIEVVNDLEGNATLLATVNALATQNAEFLSQLNTTQIKQNETIQILRNTVNKLGASIGDTDYDGLDDLDEIYYGTSITLMDTDCDNLNDAFEIKYGTDPLVDDTDGDGYFDGIEVASGTDPLDPNDYPGKTSPPSQGIPGFDLFFMLIGAAIIGLYLMVQISKRK